MSIKNKAQGEEQSSLLFLLTPQTIISPNFIKILKRVGLLHFYALM
jgi:hypothetical protein